MSEGYTVLARVPGVDRRYTEVFEGDLLMANSVAERKEGLGEDIMLISPEGATIFTTVHAHARAGTRGVRDFARRPRPEVIAREMNDEERTLIQRAAANESATESNFGAGSPNAEAARERTAAAVRVAQRRAARRLGFGDY